ncbi:conserved hypothetical protein [Ricinus communis]|uniref:Uncharacterized protein n=1 Tax=Ricinus communis TaxID=3988 RepID=B9RKU6_RICCO|nr:conserved hypothetical protein [Ricinus communis]
MDSTVAELKDSVKAMRSINEKQEKRVRYLETRSTQLAIFYILFQVAILLSISKPSSISCNIRWIPFSLSLLVAVIFCLTFSSTVTKWAGTKFAYEQNLVEESFLFYKITLAQHNQLKPEGSSDQQNSNILQEQEQQLLKPDMLKVYMRRAYIYVTAFVLIAYTGVILQACRSIPCDDRV